MNNPQTVTMPPRWRGTMGVDAPKVAAEVRKGWLVMSAHESS